MDGFALLVLGSLGAVVLVLVFIGLKYPGSGADVLDWRPTRSPELEAELELRDVAQMLEAQNARRRIRGAPELTEEQIQARVQEDRRVQARLRERHRSAEQERLDRLDAEQMRRLLAARRAARRTSPG